MTSHFAVAPRRTSARATVALVGYVLLFLSVLALDQGTKWHSEKSYLLHSDAQDTEVYQAGHKLVAGFGQTPGGAEAARVAGASPADVAPVSANWIEFNVTYLRNHGAVWGVFSGLPTTARLGLFYSVTAIAVAGVLFLFRRTPRENTLYRTALVFILAGALGNFVDRLLLKYVIDWIHFQWTLFGWEYSFPVFNVADMSIDVGIGLMLLDMVVSERVHPETEHTSAPRSDAHLGAT